MHKSVKLITALSVAGLAVAAGSAFTGTGVTTTGTAAADQFVGGTVSQTVTGATLDSIVYGFVSDGTNTAVDEVTLTFADTNADGNTAGLDLTIAGTPDTTVTFTCEPIGSTLTKTSVCTPEGVPSVTGVKKAAVTVS